MASYQEQVRLDKNMLNTFTRRHRLDFEVHPLHYQSIPLSFRLDFVKLILEKAHEGYSGTMSEYRFYRALCMVANQAHFKLLTEDDIHENYSSDLLVEVVQGASWHQLLSMLEEAVDRMGIRAKAINELLAYHHVGYELVQQAGAWQIEVKYEAVVEQMEMAIEITTPYPKINALVREARKDLADPQNIQIENSIKNSIQAIEGFMIQWLIDRHQIKCARLGEVVKEIKTRKLADGTLTEALHQFYIYRNRTPNVGHGSVHDADATAADALLINDMAISFINYFGRKAVE